MWMCFYYWYLSLLTMLLSNWWWVCVLHWNLYIVPCIISFHATEDLFFIHENASMVVIYILNGLSLVIFLEIINSAAHSITLVILVFMDVTSILIFYNHFNVLVTNICSSWLGPLTLFSKLIINFHFLIPIYL